MKSKRANEYLNRAQVWGSQRKIAEKAVERAESDAREMAKRACKRACGNKFRVNQGRGDLQGFTMCPYGSPDTSCFDECPYLLEFLDAYDNE